MLNLDYKAFPTLGIGVNRVNKGEITVCAKEIPSDQLVKK